MKTIILLALIAVSFAAALSRRAGKKRQKAIDFGIRNGSTYNWRKHNIPYRQA